MPSASGCQSATGGYVSGAAASGRDPAVERAWIAESASDRGPSTGPDANWAILASTNSNMFAIFAGDELSQYKPALAYVHKSPRTSGPSRWDKRGAAASSGW